MKKYSIYILLALLLSASCTRDQFADINTDPSSITKPDLTFLFTSMLTKVNNGMYTEWFYDNDKYLLPWVQLTVGQSGAANSEELNFMKEYGGRWGSFYDVMSVSARIQNIIDKDYTGADQASAQYLRYATYPLVIFKGLRATDLFGSMPYTQAMKAPYTNPPLLKPMYDNQEVLLTTWNAELKKCVEVMSNPVMFDGKKVTQLSLGSQDLAYGGDWTKWIKLSNTLRLKIATRLYLANPQAAIAIVNEVAADGRYIKEVGEEYVYYAGTENTNFGDDRWLGRGSFNFIKFLRDNRDPRLRFFFNKNAFSSTVIQAYLNANKQLPDEMLNYIELSPDGKTFVGWKNDGDLWGRYHGVANAILSDLTDADKQRYFNSTNYTLPDFDKTPFYPYSSANVQFIQPNKNYQYPDIIEKGKLAPEYNPSSKYALKGRYVTAAESWYILAEFKVLGATITESANTLFQNAIKTSIESANKTAIDHHMPYTELTDQKDPFATSILLKDGEIATLLTKDAYTLTGTKSTDLEKIYVNMLIHYFSSPSDAYMVARKGGVPMTNSAIGFPRAAFDKANTYAIPRRFNINSPTLDNINYQNIMDAAKAQGFTFNLGTQPEKLQSERMWYDKNAPAWGAGPKN